MQAHCLAHGVPEPSALDYARTVWKDSVGTFATGLVFKAFECHEDSGKLRAAVLAASELVSKAPNKLDPKTVLLDSVFSRIEDIRLFKS
jgi:hypothetical protein